MFRLVTFKDNQDKQERPFRIQPWSRDEYHGRHTKGVGLETAWQELQNAGWHRNPWWKLQTLWLIFGFQYFFLMGMPEYLLANQQDHNQEPCFDTEFFFHGRSS